MKERTKLLLKGITIGVAAATGIAAIAYGAGKLLQRINEESEAALFAEHAENADMMGSFGGAEQFFRSMYESSRESRPDVTVQFEEPQPDQEVHIKWDDETAQDTGDGEPMVTISWDDDK